MIIIEGADNCGKTTLVEDLRKLDPRLKLIRRKRFRPNQNETIATSYINSLLPKDGDRVSHGYGIMDRLLASEIVYGDLVRDGSRITPGEHLAILNLLISYRAIVIHCDVPDTQILKTWKDRDQMYDDPIRIAQSYRERFETIFRGCSVIRYDWTSADAYETRRRICRDHVRRMKDARRTLSWWSNVPFGVGQMDRPNVILIGDSLSPQAKYPVPFSNGPAGSFLAWALERVDGWDESEVYITNAIKGTNRDATILREELCFLASSRTTVFLLGREAEEMYRRIELTLDDPPRSVHRIPHPMHWKRFHWSDREKYPRMIEEALQQGLAV